MAEVTDKDEKMHQDNISFQVKNRELFTRMNDLDSENKMIKTKYKGANEDNDKEVLAHA